MSRRSWSLLLTVVAGLVALGGLSVSGTPSAAANDAHAVLGRAASLPIVETIGAPLLDASRQLAHDVGTAVWLSRAMGALTVLLFGVALISGAARRRQPVLLALRSRAPPLS